MAEDGVLRSLLGLVASDEPTLTLARDGGHAFVSSSLRPYLIAALADLDEAPRSRPMLVVVSDDRAARDLASDLRAWLAPRRVRYYPSRGVAYESHLAPPRTSSACASPRWTRCSARRAASRRGPSWWSAQPPCRRRCRTRRCGPTRSRSGSASCSTSRSAPASSSAPATSTSTRSRNAGSSR